MTTAIRVSTTHKHWETDYDVCVKSIIIGDSSVGKSSLLYRFCESDWNPHYIATIGVDFKIRTFERNAKIVKLQLWDTAGQERFRTITHSYYRGAHGIMIVFDLTNRETFDNVAVWLQDVKKYGTSGAPMVLIGNKCDCAAQHRQVPDAEAQALADSLGCKYIQTSAKDNIGVDEAFEHITDECVRFRIRLKDEVVQMGEEAAPGKGSTRSRRLNLPSSRGNNNKKRDVETTCKC